MDVTQLDATDPAYKDDPYRTYAGLPPVSRVTLNGMPAWLVTRYDYVRRAFSDPHLSNDLGHLNAAIDAGGAWVTAERAMGLDRNLLRSDGATHGRLRRLVSKAFTPARIESMRPKVEAMADELAARFRSRGEVELIGEFAFPFALTVIMELLGMPEDEQAQFHLWARQMVPRPDTQEEQKAGYAAVRGYFTELVAKKVREPGDDLLSALVKVRDEGNRLDEEELLGMAWLLFTAGHSTTADLIGTGTLALLNNPDRLAELRADPARLPAAIEECIRFDGALELAISRFTTGPVTFGDVTIPGDGQVVLLAIAAADRDPGRFPDPDRFDPRRDASGHVGFGHGIHYCLGVSLARMELAIAFRIILGLRDLELADTRLAWHVNPHLRGLDALPLRFTPGEAPSASPRSATPPRP
ncbi:cytochrome P450 [Amycolatopsis sp. cg5]|uniref:cytochrome P450 family protein n=1 Tax=Amycolatopsis sp. cg5 TaxID=3238802 RepID=UPI0035258CBD